MISLNEIQLLEQKIEAVITKLMRTTDENVVLSQRCLQLESENQGLRDKLLSLEQDQQRIEQGIIKAIDKLNTVENSVLQFVTGDVSDVTQGNNEVQSSLTTSDFIDEFRNDTQGSVSENSIQPDQSFQIENDYNSPDDFEDTIIDRNHNDLNETNELFSTENKASDAPDETVFTDTQEDYSSGQLDIF